MSAERELESIRRNLKDLISALEGKSICDAAFVVRYLKGILPWEPLSDRPVCVQCEKEIPPGETVYEIRGYTGTFTECESCFGGES